MEQFFAGSINAALQSFRKRLRGYVKAGGRGGGYFEHSL